MSDTQPIVSAAEDGLQGIQGNRGLSVAVAAIFIVGTMCGSGILALPKALVDAGWAGIPLLIICGLLSSYTGSILGKCWTILRIRYPNEYSKEVSDPYPAIAFRAAGKWGNIATHCCIVATLFGGATVFLLLISGNISNLILKLGNKEFHTCFMILIIAVVLTPLTWLGTPKEFWQAGILAAVTTTLGGILIVVNLIVMAGTTPTAHHSNPTFAGFFNAFGTILFAFGGASCFPTIQVDMQNPDKFPIAVVIGIMAVLSLYIPVSVAGFAVIGDRMSNSNILDELEAGWILYAVIILITSHLLMAFLIVINPINQALDILFNLENRFTIKRCLVRSGTMVLVLLAALTIPHFGVILSLVGGTTVTATNFLFPPLFYLLLARQKYPEDAYGSLPQLDSQVNKEEESKKFDSEEEPKKASLVYPAGAIPWAQFEIPMYVKVILVEIIIIGLVGGVSSTYSVILSLVDGSSGFTVPCYVDWATADV